MNNTTNTPSARGAQLPPMRRPGRGPGPIMHVEKPKNAGKTLRRLLKYIGASKYILAALVVVMVAITLLGLCAPLLQSKAIDTITLDNSRLSVDFSRLKLTLGILLATYIASSVMTYFQGLLSAKLSQSVVHLMRKALFERIAHLPVRFVDTHNHGDIMSRMTNDVENISNSLSQSIGSLISGVLTVIGAFAIMLYHSPLLTGVSMVSIVFSAAVSKYLTKYMRKFFLRKQVILGGLNGQVEEVITGYHTVVAYGKEKKSLEKFNAASEDLRRVSIKSAIFGGVMGPFMNVIGNLGFLLIAGFGGWLALRGAITVGLIQAFIQYSKQFNRPIVEIANQYVQIQTAIAGAERIFEIMDAEVEHPEGSEHTEVRGDISFENVNFSYVPDKPVLVDFNLEVKRGKKLAIVGATGSGKTTVVNLLTRFYDVDSGTISIGGKDISKIERSDLRGAISIVLQDTVLFNASVEENIRYGRLDASREEIVAAAKLANADSFINRLENGYDTVLSESGSNLSEGQRQLLSIARAVLANPEILILDEATSSVDTRTEMNIQSAMFKLMENRTSLIIAHRLSTIRDADTIIVVDSGRVVESGTHDELYALGGCYSRLYQNQFAGMST